MPAPTNDALRDALKRTGAVLKQADLPFALAGGYALWVRGAGEPEHDVDFVIAEADAGRARAAVAAGGLDVGQPPEDWLFKITINDVVVDVFYRAAGETVTAELLDRAEVLDVLSMRLPVLPATDVMSAKLRALTENYCDFAPLLTAVRSVREQIDWVRLRGEVSGNDFAVAFLSLVDRLGMTDRA